MNHKTVFEIVTSHHLRIRNIYVVQCIVNKGRRLSDYAREKSSKPTVLPDYRVEKHERTTPIGAIGYELDSTLS